MRFPRGFVVAAAIAAGSGALAQTQALLPAKPELEKKLLASDGATGDVYGIAVALSGDTAVVGAWRADPAGKAYLYERNFGGPDAWGETRVLLPSNPLLGDNFGDDVAIQGDRVVVGATLRNGTGTALIFERDAGGPSAWSEVAELVPPPFANGFGKSIGLDGDRIVVGAFASRSAHIFERDAGGSWTEVATLQPVGLPVSSGFGVSVALALDRIVVGDWEAGGCCEFGPGSAYVFERDLGGPGNWGLVKRLRPTPLSSFFLYGFDVAAQGDLVVVGGQNGTVFVYDRNAGGIGSWGEIKRLTTSSLAFGIALGLDGERLAVGGFMKDAPFPLPDPEVVFVFERHLGGENAFGELARVAVPRADAGNYFGFALDLSGGHLLAGAYADDERAPDAGAAYVYRLAAPPSPVPAGKRNP